MTTIATAPRVGAASRPRTSPLPWTTLIFGAALVFGIVWRFRTLGRGGAAMNADNGVVYLMSLRAGHGHVSVFFWGQPYGGTLLQLTVGPLMRITSESAYAFQALCSLWWLAGVFAWRALATRVWGRAAGDLLGAFLWIGTSFSLALSLKDPGFYSPTFAVTGLGLALAAPARRPGWRRAVGAGLCAGLLVWTNPLGIAVAVPILALLAVRRPTPARAAAALAAAVVGAFPYLVWNHLHGWASLHTRHQRLGLMPNRILGVGTDLVSWIVPFASVTWWRVGIGLAFYAVLVAGLVHGVVRRRADVFVVALTGLLSALALAYSYVHLGHADRRYAVFLLPFALTLLSGWLTAMRRPATAVSVTTLVALLALSLHTAQTTRVRATPIGDARWGSGIASLSQYLEARGDTLVWANYWTSYAVSAESGQRIVAAALAPNRYPPWARQVEQVQDTVVVVAAGRPDDRILATRTGLPPHTRTVVAKLYAVWEFDGHVPYAKLPLGAF